VEIHKDRVLSKEELEENKNKWERISIRFAKLHNMINIQHLEVRVHGHSTQR
jgi:hypothetical protein